MEVYLGGGESAASRDGLGVAIYPLRTQGLSFVLRPTAPFNLREALTWFFAHAEGQRYDWLGLLRFAWRAKVVPNRFDNRQFCSEFAARFYRAGGFDPFNKQDADAVAPFMFLYCPFFLQVYPATLDS